MAVPVLSYVDRVIFSTASGGAGSFAQAGAVLGYQTMAAAGAVAGANYGYAAQLPDLSQWEVGWGAWNGSTLTRNVLFNSLATTSPISFSSAPQVMITVLGEGLPVNRAKQIADTNYYVSGAIGNDANDGLTSGTAWKTLQHADDTIANTIDLNGFGCTINVAVGTYVGVANINGYYSSSASNILHSTLGLIVKYIGDPVTPTNVVITPAIAPDGTHCGYFREGDPLREIDSSWNGFNFTGTMGSVILNETGSIVTMADPSGSGGWQIDAGCSNAIFVGRMVLAGTGKLNGTAWGGATPSAMWLDNNVGFGLSSNFFNQSTITITGNPSIGALVAMANQSSATWEFGATVTGAYTGQAFSIGGGSQFNPIGIDINDPKFGTPTDLPSMSSTALYVSFAGKNLQAFGNTVVGQLQHYVAPITGFSLTLGLYDGPVILDPAGTLATGTITLMSPALDGMRVSIRTSQQITALTVNAGAGQSIKGAPTTLALGGTIDAVYRATNTTWYL
jgi:hypothetical protein